VGSAVYAPVEQSYGQWVPSTMELRHRQLSSTPSSKRLGLQPGTSQSVARLVPLPDTSSGDSDDIWANPDSEQRGSIAHLAVQGVGLKGPGPMSPEINVTKARVHSPCIPNLVTVTSMGKGTGPPCKPGTDHPFVSAVFKWVNHLGAEPCTQV